MEPRRSLHGLYEWMTLLSLLLMPSGDIDFIPTNYVSVYKHWLDNIPEMTISRQLWWGHSIPAYYVREEVFVAESKEEALVKLNLTLQMTTSNGRPRQDPMRSTWFSSWLWPISVFDGFKEDQREFDYYYLKYWLPDGTSFSFDVRMIFAVYVQSENRQKGLFHRNGTGHTAPKNVKSLGNSPDA